MLYYQNVKHCIRYQTYQFQLDKLTEQQYFLLRQFIYALGKNTNPVDFPVLHIKHNLFVIDFPNYGFPYFKISFNKTTSTKEVDYYLIKINNFLNTLLLKEEEQHHGRGSFTCD